MEDRPGLAAFNPHEAVPVKAFADPDPFQEFNYPNPIAARRAISHWLEMPLAKLPPDSTTIDRPFDRKTPKRNLNQLDGRVSQARKYSELSPSWLIRILCGQSGPLAY